MLNIFDYSFMIRALEVGLVIGIVAPLIGIFLVLRRYSLIADTLSHVSLAGVALGFLLNINPILTAIGTTILSSYFIEKLRNTRKVYGESALSIFLSGSLAIAVILISIAHGYSVDIFNYLFGSIVTVKNSDVLIIFVAGLVVVTVIWAFFKEMMYISFDEEAAKVDGIPTELINTLLIILAAVTVALSIPIVGILLISALIVIPAVSALQLRRGFLTTVFWAEGISIISVISGIIGSFYLNLPAGGTIVIITILFFLGILGVKHQKK